MEAWGLANNWLGEHPGQWIPLAVFTRGELGAGHLGRPSSVVVLSKTLVVHTESSGGLMENFTYAYVTVACVSLMCT